MTVTAQQVQNLWDNGGTLDRGQGHEPVHQQELGEMGDIDVHDDGTLGPGMAQVLADQINSYDA
ncbi:hypothetical protein [Streptomyces sp. CC224B]|uniref:hypothetical protein n=1 Tax=Streptomyces sp. CC224B TaxID=3044571 RepID=UPI0024A7F6E2|nr:hypothetical protein [Streptomyces sp. CC224B]